MLTGAVGGSSGRSKKRENLPNEISSPAFRTRGAVSRSPFTKVPLAEPMSQIGLHHLPGLRLVLAVPAGPHDLRPGVLVVHAEETPPRRIAADRQGHEADEVVVAPEL